MDPNDITSHELLDQLFRDGKITEEAYARLSDSMIAGPDEDPSHRTIRRTNAAKCPHCEQPVVLSESGPDEVVKEVKGTFKKEIMYSCPHCGRVLGFGFFMGGLLTGRP